MTSIAIIGGGISGLAVACEAQRAGLQTVVLEQASRIGGVLDTTMVRGLPCDHAAQSFAMTPEINELLSSWRIDLSLTTSNPSAGTRCIVRKGQIHRLRPHPMTLLRTQLVSRVGKWTALREIFHRDRNLPDAISLGSFVRARFGREVLEAVAVPITRGIIGCHPDDVDLDSIWPNARRMVEQHGSLIRASMRSRTSSSRRTLVVPRGGMRSLVDALGHGLDVRTDHPVHGIHRTNGIWTVDASHAGTPISIVADHVVITAPPTVAGSLLDAVDAELADMLRGISSSSLTLHHEVFDASVPQASLDAFGALMAEGGQSGLLGIIDHGSTFPSRTNGYRHLVYFISGTSDDIRTSAIDEAHRLLGVTASPLATHTVRWPHAIPIPAPGHRRVLEAAAQMEVANPGLWLAGSWRYGISIPACLTASRTIVQRLLHHDVI